MYVPKRIFFTSGAGVHRERLTSFEMALRDAGIAPFNLVRVSSIFPPHCHIVPIEEGLNSMMPGQIIHCVMSENATNEPFRNIAASVGVAIPENENLYGYLSEHHSFGQKKEEAGGYAEYLAAEMFATLREKSIPDGEEKGNESGRWDISGEIINTTNVTHVASGNKDGEWTTVVACAVLLP